MNSERLNWYASVLWFTLFVLKKFLYWPEDTVPKLVSPAY
ncbi:2040_t:CDS:2 [Funneliformis caledonium]|uniref:2040_t:CDS:1 n=2 Tax=Funneliformis TaxID=1117308 RepID=A0A9N8YPW2_9GLOM|nr:7494_t:CDS:2 [Funneliformis mosseae]CAG8438213.1 2040_t:CDS:2 [Funneliformis caledonium]